jgi:hypothetical protein
MTPSSWGRTKYYQDFSSRNRLVLGTVIGVLRLSVCWVKCLSHQPRAVMEPAEAWRVILKKHHDHDKELVDTKTELTRLAANIQDTHTIQPSAQDLGRSKSGG